MSLLRNTHNTTTEGIYDEQATTLMIKKAK